MRPGRQAEGALAHLGADGELCEGMQLKRAQALQHIKLLQKVVDATELRGAVRLEHSVEALPRDFHDAGRRGGHCGSKAEVFVKKAFGLTHRVARLKHARGMTPNSLLCLPCPAASAQPGEAAAEDLVVRRELPSRAAAGKADAKLYSTPVWIF